MTLLTRCPNPYLNMSSASACFEVNSLVENLVKVSGDIGDWQAKLIAMCRTVFDNCIKADTTGNIHYCSETLHTCMSAVINGSEKITARINDLFLACIHLS